MRKNLIPLFKNKKQAVDVRQFNEELAVDVLARTLWGEARSEGSIGMQAVACVIVNRVNYAKGHDGYWWGNTIVQVCQKPYQFSCWNKDDPNYRKLLQVDDSDLYFVTARRIARRAVLATLSDPTDGSTHYHVSGIYPYWTKGEKPVAVIGRHIFYNLKGS